MITLFSQTRRRLSLFASLTTLALVACSSGSGVKYFVVGGQQFSIPQGTNCGGLTNGACQLGNVGGGNCAETTTTDTQATWALYPGSGNNYYLAGVLQDAAGASTVLVGTQSGSGYTFAGTVTVTNTLGNSTTTDEKDVTVTLTLTGAGFTGTINQEEKINAPNASSDCSQSASLVGSEINAQEVAGINPVGSQALGNGGVGSAGGGNGGNGTGGNGTGGNGNGGNGTGSSFAGNYAVQPGASFSDPSNPATPPNSSENISQSGNNVTWSNFGAPTLGCTLFLTASTGTLINLTGQTCNGFNFNSGVASLSTNGGVNTIDVSAQGTDPSGSNFSLSFILQD